MIDLNKLLLEWEGECAIDTHLDTASKSVPILHAKYLRLHTQANVEYKNAQLKHKELMRNKWLHYNGKLPKEEIEQMGWSYDPLNGLKVLKGDMDKFYEADKDIQDSDRKVSYLKLCVDQIKEIMEALKWRHQTIKNMMDYLRFEAGG